jgi:hypothetical protein
MRLMRVALHQPTWDPMKPYTHAGDRGIHRHEFSVADGYTLELEAGLLTITTPGGRTNAIASSNVSSSEVASAQPGIVPSLPTAAEFLEKAAAERRRELPSPAPSHPQAELPRGKRGPK